MEVTEFLIGSAVFPIQPRLRSSQLGDDAQVCERVGKAAAGTNELVMIEFRMSNTRTVESSTTVPASLTN